MKPPTCGDKHPELDVACNLYKTHFSNHNVLGTAIYWPNEEIPES